MPVGLYIHVPFCTARCHFCAFYLQIHRPDRAARYVASLAHEMRLHAARETLGGRRISTVYFGGGTPTTLTTEQLSGVLEHVRSLFGLEIEAEVSIEAHPDTVTPRSLDALAEAGFNRISFGVQSADETELNAVGRHAIARGASTVSRARGAGFCNINVDLIYGLPGQTRQSWRHTLEEVLAAGPTHLSCYALTVEQQARLAVDLSRGQYAGPDADLQNEMEEQAVDLLHERGFVRYEISNWSRPGYPCRHNVLYWTDQDYLGLGPSAQSYVSAVRFGNVASLQAYEDAIESDQLPIEERVPLSRQQRIREAVAFGLRRLSGVELQLVDRLIESDPGVGRTLERLLDLGLLVRGADGLRLSDRGLRLADSVAGALV